MITAEQVRDGVISKAIKFMHLRDCSICGYNLGYLVQNGSLYYDNGCYCVRRPPQPAPRDWQNLADLINDQTEEIVRLKFMGLVGL